MSVITRLDVPKDALSQHRYFQGLVTLSRYIKVQLKPSCRIYETKQLPLFMIVPNQLQAIYDFLFSQILYIRKWVCDISLGYFLLLASLLSSCSALSQEGNKAQALALLKKAAEYEPMVTSIYVSKLEEELRLENTKNNWTESGTFCTCKSLPVISC